MRIRELAKNYGISNKELLNICQKLKITVSSHMSNIEGNDAKILMDYFNNLKKKEPGAELKDEQDAKKKIKGKDEETAEEKSAQQSVPEVDKSAKETSTGEVSAELKEEHGHGRGFVKASDAVHQDAKGVHHQTKEIEEKKKLALLKLKLIKYKMEGKTSPADLPPELRELMEQEEAKDKPVEKPAAIEPQPAPKPQAAVAPPVEPEKKDLGQIKKKPDVPPVPQQAPPQHPPQPQAVKPAAPPQQAHPAPPVQRPAAAQQQQFVPRRPLPMPQPPQSQFQPRPGTPDTYERNRDQRSPHRIKPTIQLGPVTHIKDAPEKRAPQQEQRHEQRRFDSPRQFNPQQQQQPPRPRPPMGHTPKPSIMPASEPLVDDDKKRRRRKKKKDIYLTAPPTIEVMSFKDSKYGRDKKKGKLESKDKAVKKPRIANFALDDPHASFFDSAKAKHKKIRPSFLIDPKRDSGSSESEGESVAAVLRAPAVPKSKKIQIKGDITVGNFAEKIEQSVGDIIKKILLMGQAATINQIIEPALCELLALEYGYEIEIIPESDEHDIEDLKIEDDKSKMQLRPPVITIMGHVDHGKTTLLDTFRKSDLAAMEYGGITQHIGAYYVTTPKGYYAFLDTPGHEAFTQMRARGAKVTDFVILVVSATDGVQPQTVEAINHAKAANVPIIVAINKIDLPGANPTRIKQELMKYELVSEELGGQTIFAEISAKKGIGIEHLLEMISLQSEIMELKADPNRPAEGMIIESHVDPNRGVVATVLVQKGTLKAGDAFLSGSQAGKVRFMMDEHGRQIDSAGPSRPVSLLGFTELPNVGELFIVLRDEKTAREIADKRKERRRTRSFYDQQRSVTLENLHEFIATGAKEFNVILKGDVQGTVEAIVQAIDKLSTDKIKMKLLHAGVGAINDSDVNLAIASNAVIIGFNVRPDSSASELAERKSVDIKTYRIIYDLLDDIKKAMKGMLEPKFKEVIQGHAEVRQVFKISKVGNVAGCYVVDGEISRNSKARLIRDNVVVYDGEILTLRRVKEDVAKVATGFECGITLNRFEDIKNGDMIETFSLEEVPQEI